MSAAEEQMQQLRSQATVLLLREEWGDSIHLYSQLIDVCQARISNTNQDPNPDPDHLSKLNKSLCIAFSNRAEARSKLQDFTRALQDCDGALRIEPTHFKTLYCKGKILLSLNRYLNALDASKQLYLTPGTGSFDLSDWVLNGLKGMPPELAEYIGPVVVKRGILGGQDSAENAQLVMWKNFIDKVKETVTKCQETQLLINMLSTGEDEVDLEVPAVSAKVLGKNSDFYGIGLWILASFINHSCNPNARRLHVGDYVMVHASRDVKAGEEITFMYFDTLSPFEKRAEMSMSWGFNCNVADASLKELRLEEGMKRWAVRGKGKGYLRASYWPAYAEVYGSDRSMKRWSRQIPKMEAIVDSVVEVGKRKRGIEGCCRWIEEQRWCSGIR
ncbi:ATP/GTP-binding family protein, putative isoform 1 [Hibiscus syriacus]|uniref:ATP/GTP-binding family protein, putative isoform 1 n=1 Tax=Hibiscus syriacus TaxID=106335 RepID=A0A6A2YUC4_HIBSY|nr:ATP/GTP-binding family protein, putative isoform 1 [Hibiscus syriacus]